MVLNIILLLAGFTLLIKGADVFVDGSVSIAEKLKVPSLIIGLTIVSLGTSAPEAVVSITASVKGSDTLSVGNVVGSNVFNLLVVAGMCGLMKPFAASLKDISKDFWISIGAALALMLMMIASTDKVPRFASIIILAVFLGYMALLVRQAQKIAAAAGMGEHRSGEDKSGEMVSVGEAPGDGEVLYRAERFCTAEPGGGKEIKPLWQSVLTVAIGCGMIIAGGQLTVTNAVEIARSIGITERIVGLTIVALGTSLPELVTSVVAGRKGETGIALGNVVGSNIFNIMFVLGMAGSISPLTVDTGIIIDLIFLIAASLLVMLFVRSGNRITRIEGLVMVALYAGYMTYVFI